MAGTTTVIIGAGHAGLAMSRCLTERSIDHVVLERGEVANSWRRERWDSLRLLTPNWQTKLPGTRYRGADPDGFMKMAEVVDFVASYAAGIDAPVTPTPDADCFQNPDPNSHVQIINACTTAQKIYKDPALPLANPDGSLPPLP